MVRTKGSSSWPPRSYGQKERLYGLHDLFLSHAAMPPLWARVLGRQGPGGLNDCFRLLPLCEGQWDEWWTLVATQEAQRPPLEKRAPIDDAPWGWPACSPVCTLCDNACPILSPPKATMAHSRSRSL